MKKLMLILSMIFICSCAHQEWERVDGKKVTYSNWIGDHQNCYFNTGNFAKRLIPIYGHIYNMRTLDAYFECMDQKGYIYKK